MDVYCSGYRDFNGNVINKDHRVKINGVWVDAKSKSKSGDSHSYCPDCLKHEMAVLRYGGLKRCTKCGEKIKDDNDFSALEKEYTFCKC